MIKKNKLNLHGLNIKIDRNTCGFIELTFWDPSKFLFLNEFDENLKSLQNDISFTLQIDISGKCVEFRSNMYSYIRKGNYHDKSFFIMKTFIKDITCRIVLKDAMELI